MFIYEAVIRYPRGNATTGRSGRGWPGRRGDSDHNREGSRCPPGVGGVSASSSCAEGDRRAEEEVRGDGTTGSHNGPGGRVVLPRPRRSDLASVSVAWGSLRLPVYDADRLRGDGFGRPDGKDGFRDLGDDKKWLRVDGFPRWQPCLESGQVLQRFRKR